MNKPKPKFKLFEKVKSKETKTIYTIIEIEFSQTENEIYYYTADEYCFWENQLSKVKNQKIKKAELKAEIHDEILLKNGNNIFKTNIIGMCYVLATSEIKYCTRLGPFSMQWFSEKYIVTKENWVDHL